VTAATTDVQDWFTAVSGAAIKLYQDFVGGGGSTINVSQYSSVQVLLLNLDNTSFLSVEYEFVDSNSTQTIDSGLLSADANHSVAGDNWPVWELPVRANTLRLTNLTGGSPLAIVLGRPETRRKGMATSFYPRRVFQGTVPASTAANTGVELPGQDGNGNTPILRDCSNYNGLVTVNIGVTQSITGQVQFMFRDKSGARIATSIMTNPPTTSTPFQFGHPFAYMSWRFFTTAVSPASPTTVIVQVFPASGDG
jgi:hypothetical protein